MNWERGLVKVKDKILIGKKFWEVEERGDLVDLKLGWG